MAVPAGVETDIFPERAPIGTVVLMLVVVAVVTVASAGLKRTSLLPVESKFVPVIVIGLPVVPTVGVIPVIVGALGEVPVTVKFVLLVADPAGGDVTAIGPLPPTGTVATICVDVDETTVAVTPLNVTLFWHGVVQ